MGRRAVELPFLPIREGEVVQVHVSWQERDVRRDVVAVQSALGYVCRNGRSVGRRVASRGCRLGVRACDEATTGGTVPRPHFTCFSPYACV